MIQRHESEAGPGVVTRRLPIGATEEQIRKALREADPDYRPDDDPGPNDVVLPSDPQTRAAVGIVAVGLVVVLVLVLLLPAKKAA